MTSRPTGLLLLTIIAAGGAAHGDDAADGTLASRPTQARAADGAYISWREHLVDGETVDGTMLRGSDGLQIADLDRDGYADIVSVHESDDQYDGVPEGHIRIAYGAAVALVMFVLPTLLLLAMVLASGGAMRLAPMALVLPLALIMLPTLFASFYASYRDVFGAAPAAEGS